jgi:putative nucleotidyltransferase with HDIG domain
VESSIAFIERIKSLPALSPALQKIREVMACADTSAADIVDVLKLDPAISTKVLRLANSAYIGIPRTVSSLQNAVVILGQKRIYSLVLAASTLASIPRGTGIPFNIVDFWKHSVTTALICESIARHLQRYGDIETGDYFCAGILHDIGKLALVEYDAARICEVRERSQQSGIPFFRAEDEDMSHMHIGYYLGHRWNFPDNLTNTIMYHHAPERAVTCKKIAAIVHVADIMAHMVGFQTFPGEVIPLISNFAVTQISLPPERLRTIAQEVSEDEKQIESMLDFIQ